MCMCVSVCLCLCACVCDTQNCFLYSLPNDEISVYFPNPKISVPCVTFHIHVCLTGFYDNNTTGMHNQTIMFDHMNCWNEILRIMNLFLLFTTFRIDLV